MTLTELCQELKNWFCIDEDKHIGDFTIVDGTISPSIEMKDGQFFRIIGSYFNDGVHTTADELVDDEFHGGIWLMRVPPDVLSLLDDINDYEAEYGAVNLSPYQSESFGGYSYTKASRGQLGNNSGAVVTWRDAFASRLNKWRKI